MGNFKVLWFNWRCWLNPEMGGAEIFTHEIMKRWVQAGHEVTFCTSEFPNSKSEEVLDGIRIVRKGRKYAVYGNAKKLYKKVFSKENYDVVIDEVNTRPFFTPKYVNNGEKIVSLIHQLAREYWFYETPFPVNYFGYHFFENRWLKNYVDVPTVTVSESTRRDLEHLGFKDIHVVPEGLNFEPLPSLPEKELYPVVVYAGRLKPAKRPDHVVKAFKLVRSKLPKAELWIIGNGSFKAHLERMAGDGVRFFDGVDNGKRRELIQRAWVLANPSVREGFGLNVVEANALGVPCVAYDVGGLRDAVLDGQTGLLVESGNTTALGQAICRLMEDHILRAKFAAAALEYSRGFSWDNAAEEFMKVVRTVVGAERRR